MGAILGVIAIWSAFFIFGFIRRGISAKIWRGWTLKKIALAALPLALIVVTELISPSIGLTGYIAPPKPVALQWHSEKSGWTDATLTWADVNHHLFGTDTDGYLPKEMLQAQLEQRKLEIKIKHGSALRSGSIHSGLSGSFKRRHNAYMLQLNALNASIENLGALYANGPVTPQEFRLWQAKIVVDIAILRRDRTENLYKIAFEKLIAWNRANPEATNDNRNRTPLQREYSDALRISKIAPKDLERARAQQATFAKRFEFARPSDRFSPPPWPLELASATNNARTSDLRSEVLKGPNATTGLLEWLVRAFKAFDNDTRMSASIPSGIKCYISITGQTGALEKNKICEIHTPVLINFDLTIGHCTPSKTLSCTERWVLPDLTILLRDKSVTFLPPRPTTPAMRSASRWEITVNGETKPLKGAATFDLTADQRYRLPDYVLRQLPIDTADEIRIWKNFETASFLRDKTALRNDQSFHIGHVFAGHPVTTPQLSRKAVSILAGFGQNAKPWKNYRDVEFLSMMNVYSRGGSFETSGCFFFTAKDLHSSRAVSKRLASMTPRGKNWVLEQTPVLNLCRHANTLTALYEGIWPTDPSKVFTDN